MILAMSHEKEERITRLIESLHAVGLYESILIRGNMTIEECEHLTYDDRYTSWYEKDSKIGFLTKKKYWL